MLRGVAGSVEHSDENVPQLKHIPFAYAPEVVGGPGFCVENVLGSGSLRQPAAARDVVRMHVRIYHVFDLHARRAGCFEVGGNLLLWIHHSRNRLPPSPEKVGSPHGIKVQELSEDHRSPPVSFEKKRRPFTIWPQ